MRSLGTALTFCSAVVLVLGSAACAQTGGDPKRAGVSRRGLIAHYTFDEGSGDVIHDGSGHEHHAKILGRAEWVKLVKGYALKFDGKDDYVDCGKDLGLERSREGSVELWFKPFARQGGLVSCHTGNAWRDERLVLTFDTYHGDGKLLWIVADGLAHAVGSTSPHPKENEWSHIALTYDGVDVKVYRDGVLSAAAPQLYLLPNVHGVPLLLGKSEGLGLSFYKGLMDEVRMYDRVLSGGEVFESFRREAASRGKASPKGTEILKAHARALLESGEIVVEANVEEFCHLADTVTVESEVLGTDLKEAMPLRNRDAWICRLRLDARDLETGSYKVRVLVTDKGLPVGRSVVREINWRRFPAAHKRPRLGETPAGNFYLVRDGKPLATVVIPAKAEKRVTTAASWLVAYIAKSTGATLHIQTDADKLQGTIISVGPTRVLAEAGLTTEGLKWDGCRFVVRGNTLFLFGRDERPKRSFGASGTSKAVVHFLEEYVGIRWFLPTNEGEFVPKKQSVSVPRHLSKTIIAAFAYSHGRRLYGLETPAAFANNFRVALRLRSYGGHSYYSWLPAKKYGRDHPEYFAMIGGKRGAGGHHLCSSNPDVKRILLKGIQSEFDNGYEWVQLGQEDGYHPCECPRCEALDNYDGTPEHPCERVLLLHKWIADECRKSHPDKIVHLLVYGPTVWPSKKFDKWPDNVVAEMCNQTPEVLDAWKGKVKGMTAYLYWYDITLRMGMGIHATPEEVAGRIRYYHEHDIIGLYQIPETNWGLLGPAYYCLAKLMGDPYRDYRAIQEEYCLGVFGKAGPMMLAFFNTLYAMPEVHSRVWPESQIRELEALLRKAEREAQGERERWWVQLTRDHFDHCKLVSRMLAGHLAYRQRPSDATWNEMKTNVEAFEALRQKVMHYPDSHIERFFPGHGVYCKYLASKYIGYYGNWAEKKAEILTRNLRGTRVGWQRGAVSAPLTFDFTKPRPK